ncbi:MAG: hypothetical protein ACPKM0_02990 [Pleomorphochaeta sp.]
MKKKLLLILLLSCFLDQVFSSDVLILSTNSIGMANAGLADSESFISPTYLTDRDENSPSVITTFSFLEELTLDELSTPYGYFQYPELDMGATVYGTNLGLTLNIDNYLEDREYDEDYLSYTAYNQFTIQLDWGYKINNFDLGMRVKASSISKRTNFDLRTNYLFLADYIVNTFFSNYTSVSDSDFFSLGLAFKYNVNDNFSFAYYSESDLDLTSNSNTNELLSYLESSSVGITYISNKYTITNQLNPLVYKICIDTVYLGDPTNRELRIGNEIKMQLGNNNNLAFRFGYYEPKDTISDFFSFDISQGTTTFALSYDNLDFSIVGDFEIPVESYSDLDNGITFGISSNFYF